MKNSHRLPSHIKPNRYKIMLRPDLEHFTFYGEETIFLEIQKKVKEITLHSSEIQILSVFYENENLKKVPGTVSYNEKEETATISFPEELPIGEGEVSFTFNGILNDKMRGFYRSKYEVDGVSMHMAVSQFESTDARRAFPCFDEPALKAIFDVTLVVPTDTTAISNTIEDAVIEHESGYKRISFLPTPKMSTYLLAFVVGKFEYIERKTPEGVLVRVFTTPGKKKQAEFALDTACRVLSFYNEYFKILYPLPVLDLVAIPDFAAGAMENWGAVTFRETALLVDEELSSAGNKQWVALVIAHELAHMWFGDLVTMEWWTHLWLNEGFACFIEYLAVNALFPEFDIWTQFTATEHNSALSLDGLKNTHPIEIPVNHPSEISEIFDEVSYAKGASIIKMLASFLGDTDFRDGLNLYLKTHAYQNATTEHLWDAFSKVSKKDVKSLMNAWTQKPGYPLLTVTETQKGLQLQQQRYFSSSISAKTSKDATTWNIPLVIKTQDKKEVVKKLMTTKILEIPKPTQGNWITCNYLESGFFRTKYESAYLTKFKNGLSSKDLTPADRLGIVRDVFDLAESGHVSGVDALLMSTYYRKETDYTVWLDLAGGIHHLYGLLHGDQSIANSYKNFAKEIFTDIAQSMGWDAKPNEKHTDVLLRSLALYGLGTYGDAQIFQKAQSLFTNFLKTTKLNPNLRGVVYNLIAENGGEEEFDTFLDLHKKEPLHQEKDRLARAISSFTRKPLIQKALDWSLSENVRAQDAARVLFAVFANPEGRELAWEFLEAHWDYYKKQFAGSHGFSNVVEGASFFASDTMADKVEAFFEKNKTLEIARTVKQVVEQIRSNAAWMERDKRNIEKFLISYKK